jgi:hypothetical protein
MTSPVEKAPEPRFGVLRTIALYKLVKVVLLLCVAYGELRLRDASLAAKLLSWAQARPYGLEHRIVTQLLEWFSGLSVSRIHALRIVTFAYAAVFAVDHHHYRLAHTAGSLGDLFSADHRQSADIACQCRGSRLSGVACAQQE